MKTYQIILLLLFPSFIFSQTEVLPVEIQIKTATLAAPEELREGVMVYGFNEQGEMVVLREGTNHLVCLADDPNKKGINVSCYSKKLEPFMARGREISAEGIGEMEKREKRKKEAEAGSLTLTDSPGMTTILTGSEENYNPETGELTDGHFRYVIYIPFATAESTGLPEKPFAPGMPWIMDSGTHRAHIMITPPKN
ncbi:hypothetical protein [Salinimicrobium terrae]|uniref:hypothetical protein n=1 Tax=Salinimicrobium terrae TaxID=470866 RepID=UPI0003FADE4B|nr:hypothetical protein [Salinimicrobium terrae]